MASSSINDVFFSYGFSGVIKKRWLLAGMFALHAGMLHAEEPASFEMHGFGTLGAVYHNTPGGVLYRRDISQTANGAARAGQVSFMQDSMLGVQGTAHIDAHLEASIQVLSRLDYLDSFEPRVSMGYVKYRMGDSFVRAGRMTIETYMKGDVAEVGYANLQVRQPIAIYPRTFNGVDAETTRPLGAGLVRIKGLVGRTVGVIAKTDVAASYDTAGSSAAGALVDYFQSGWTVRYSVYSLKMKHELAEMQPGGALSAALANAPSATQIFNALSMKDRRITGQMLALAYDEGAVQGELGYTRIQSHNWPVNCLFRAVVGYRIEQATPYVSYASSRYARQFASAYPAGLSAQTDQVNEALMQAQAGMLVNQTDMTVGVRYDFARNKALKFQYDRIRYQDPDSIVDPGLATTSVMSRGYKPMNLYSVVLDFVF
jgi:hypothetical protein